MVVEDFENTQNYSIPLLGVEKDGIRKPMK